jgi:hypothetical protein
MTFVAIPCGFTGHFTKNDHFLKLRKRSDKKNKNFFTPKENFIDIVLPKNKPVFRIQFGRFSNTVVPL